MYTIRRFKGDCPPWERAECLSINWFGWGGDYRPETEAALLYQEGRGFWLRFRCREERPRTRIAEHNGTVCHDSCVEAFINFQPETDRRYLNLEINAAGVYLLHFGEAGKRRPAEEGEERLLIHPSRAGAWWEVTAFLPQTLLRRLYGGWEAAPGGILRGNFYKCGELRPRHHAAWQPVKTAAPDFHRPEFFGRIKMDDI